MACDRWHNNQGEEKKPTVVMTTTVDVETAVETSTWVATTLVRIVEDVLVDTDTVVAVKVETRVVVGVAT